MRILYIYSSIAVLAGMERILTDKMNYLAEYLGYDVSLITYEQGEHPLAYRLSPLVHHEDLGVLLYTKSRYPMRKRLGVYRNMRKTFEKKLDDVIERMSPEIIVLTNLSYPVLDIILRAPGNHKYIIESHLSKEYALKNNHYSRLSVLRYLVHIYNYYMLRQFKRTDVLVTLTEEDRKKWKHIVPTCVIPNLLTEFPSDTSGLEQKRVISVGRLHMQKGYDLLIQAWAIVALKHKDWQLDIYGSGALRPELERLVELNNLKSSILLHEATSDIYQEYLGHSIYVMSSRYEGFGLVLVEAMSCGLPCISFDCPSGPAEIIRHNENGLLVENGDIEEMANAISYLMTNEEERKRMGMEARQSVSRYSKDEIMQRWDTLFKSILSGETDLR